MQENFGTNTSIHFYLKNLDNHIQRYLHSLYKRKDFQECSLMNMWVADYLYDYREKDIYQKDIEAEFFINRATASKMLKLMEEKQLIRRIASDTDARLKKIQLLPKGVELHEIGVVVKDEIESRLTESLTPEEVELFKSLCMRMIANMDR